MNYEKVSVYINEGEQGQNRALHLELLDMLKKYNVAEGTIFRGIAGFPLDPSTKTSLFHPSKNSPLIVQFIDSVNVIEILLPELKKIVLHHLIVRAPIEVVNWDERFSLGM